MRPPSPMDINPTVAIRAITPKPDVASPTLPPSAWQTRIEAVLPQLEQEFAGDVNTALKQVERLQDRNVKLSNELMKLRRLIRQHVSAGGLELVDRWPHTTRALTNALGAS